ncbi:hypothetical protein [Actinacidiphila glaucinigra]|uniref:hypothetical protein n=1 Tax=Actinacidiphila glaucinigra TaxID=235986 RepID=UPI00371E86C6
MAQLRRRREAAARMEPMDCGHRDPWLCGPAGCGEVVKTSPPADLPTVDPGDVAGLWATAKALFLAKDFPEYASPEWLALDPEDPKRLAAALEAAENWRKYGDDVTAWLACAGSQPPVSSGKTQQELAEARKPKEPHQLQAKPGWPPIAVPGKPGRWLITREVA